jgi:hypothetical protein
MCTALQASVTNARVRINEMWVFCLVARTPRGNQGGHDTVLTTSPAPANLTAHTEQLKRAVELLQRPDVQSGKHEEAVGQLQDLLTQLDTSLPEICSHDDETSLAQMHASVQVQVAAAAPCSSH